jgi:small subunit ribosomal protein S6
MAETRIRLYEGLFLMSQNVGDLKAALDHVQEILNRAEAETLVLRRWDDRKLAYPIQGQKRGTYILAYFNARSTQLANIERDCNLSENILRAMMVKAEHVGEAELELERQAAQERSVEPALRSEERDEPQPAAVAAEGDGDTGDENSN